MIFADSKQARARWVECAKLLRFWLYEKCNLDHFPFKWLLWRQCFYSNMPKTGRCLTKVMHPIVAVRVQEISCIFGTVRQSVLRRCQACITVGSRNFSIYGKHFFLFTRFSFVFVALRVTTARTFVYKYVYFSILLRWASALSLYNDFRLTLHRTT